MQEHIECLRSLRLILHILSFGDKAVEMADILEEAIEQHRALFVRLYAEAKPKLHDLLHIPTILRKARANINCFVTERKHKQLKMACAHMYGNFEHALTHFFLNLQIHDYTDDATLFEEGFLQNPKT